MNKAKLIIHPIRMRIVSELGHRQMTTRQLAAALPDIAQATLYRQIKQLLDGGVLAIAKEEVISGQVERTYALISSQNRLTADEIAALSAEEHMQYFSVFAAGLIDGFSRYVQQADPDNFAAEGMSYNQAIIHLTDEERREFQQQLLGIVGKVLSNPPSPDRKKYTLASVVLPDERGDK
ncbi:MAG: helix-turn-helix domain-containing protein [Chloroflexota bacterium]